jgi:hypothetical protein
MRLKKEVEELQEELKREQKGKLQMDAVAADIAAPALTVCVCVCIERERKRGGGGGGGENKERESRRPYACAHAQHFLLVWVWVLWALLCVSLTPHATWHSASTRPRAKGVPPRARQLPESRHKWGRGGGGGGDSALHLPASGAEASVTGVCNWREWVMVL